MPESESDLTTWDGDGMPSYDEWKDFVYALDLVMPEIEGWMDATKSEAWVHEQMAKTDNERQERNLALARYFWRRHQKLSEYKKRLDNEIDKEIDAAEDFIRFTWDTKNKRNEIAAEYGRLLEQYGPDGLNWSRINQAILERYSESGLSYIKNRAWRIVESNA